MASGQFMSGLVSVLLDCNAACEHTHTQARARKHTHRLQVRPPTRKQGVAAPTVPPAPHAQKTNIHTLDNLNTLTRAPRLTQAPPN